MAVTAMASLHRRLLWLVALAAALLSLWGIWRPYSFWLDEIWSVTAARESVADMFTRWIMIDVHPPLYQLLLNIWMQLFGSSEFAARSLSLLPVLALIGLLLHLVRRRPELTGYALMLLAMPWFFYNAQETRSYSLVCLWAFLALYGQLQARQTLFLSALVLMAWTHYFGLFLAMSLLFVQVVMERRLGRHEWLAAALMLLWLPVHLGLGTLFDNANGGFWLKVSGPGESIANVFSAISPGFQQAWRLFPAVSWGYALILLLGLGYLPWRQWRRGDVEPLDVQLSLSLLLFVCGIVVVDLIVPMSTQRNFLVAMPALVYVLLRLGQALFRERVWTCLLLLWLLVQLGSGYVLMQHRHGEIENFRRATGETLAAMDGGARAYYLDNCVGGRVYNSDAMNNFYLTMLDSQQRRLTRLCRSDLAGLSGDSVVMVCHQLPFAELVAAVPPGFRARAMDDKGLCALVEPLPGAGV